MTSTIITGETIDILASFEGRMAKIEGGVRSGKTEALISRASTLIANGANPEDILIATTTAEAARLARKRLEIALRKHEIDDAQTLAARTTIMPVQEACLSVLTTPVAQAYTGRTPRVLTSFEYNFFLEDMKTLGQPIRRLRSLLNLFQREWSNFHAEADWVVPGEQEETLKHARALLQASECMLEAEVAYVCGMYLQSEAGAAARKQYAVVLADDFQNASAAQQTCLCLLARDQLIVAGNAHEMVSTATRWPSGTGFTAFDTLRRDVSTFTLDESFGNPAITAFCDALSARENNEAALTSSVRTGADGNFATVKWNIPDDEFNGVTRVVFALNESKEEDDKQADLCVVAPNKQWARAFEQMLEKRGFATSSLGFERLGGDPRDFKRARAAMAYTALNLLAEPTDVAAWRAWVGYGNYLTLSDGWKALLDWCAEHDATPLEGLAYASETIAAGTDAPFLRADALAARYDAGCELIKQHQARKGFALIKAIGGEGLPEFKTLSHTMEGDEDACTLFTMMRTEQFNPTHDENAHAVRISSYEQMVGCDYTSVYAVGCVDGFMPARDAFEVVSTDEDRARVMNAGRRAFMSAIGKASDNVMFSTISKAPLELAERTKMQVARVRMENDERMAMLRPTCFIEEAGADAPLTLGGQAVLSELGID